MFESHVVTSNDRTSFDFRLEDFLSNLSLQTIIDCVTDISEVMCAYWQVLDFLVCISMYYGLYCGMYWYVLAWYVLYCKYWYVLVCTDI